MHVRSRPLSIYLIFLYKTTLNSGQNAFHSIGIRFDIRYQTVTILAHDEGMLFTVPIGKILRVNNARAWISMV